MLKKNLPILKCSLKNLFSTKTKVAPNNKDFLQTLHDLPEDDSAVWSVAEDYCQSTLSKYIIDDTRNKTFNKNIFKELGELGFLGSTIQG